MPHYCAHSHLSSSCCFKKVIFNFKIHICYLKFLTFYKHSQMIRVHSSYFLNLFRENQVLLNLFKSHQFLQLLNLQYLVLTYIYQPKPTPLRQAVSQSNAKQGYSYNVPHEAIVNEVQMKRILQDRYWNWRCFSLQSNRIF